MVSWQASPSWSPDGKNIAFMRVSSDHRSIYMMNSDGTNERLIYPFDITGEAFRYVSHHLTAPMWSSDGALIAFSVEEPNDAKDWNDDEQGLYIVKSDGSWYHKAFSWPIASNRYNPISIPSWSPKDDILAFAVNSPEENGIYLVHPDGSAPIEIVENYAGDQLVWSPDGQEILSSHGFAVRPDGTGLRQIFPPGLSGWVSWSRDGNKIAISTEDGRLIIVNRDGTGLRRLVHSNYKGEVLLSDSQEEMKALDVSICIREATLLKPVIPEPYANPGLVNDCEALLRSAITLDGIANLDWTKDNRLINGRALSFAATLLELRD